MEPALRLLYDYNEYLEKTAHWKNLARSRHIQRRRVTPANLAVMERLIEWCAELDVDPRLWLHSLFVARYWAYAPPFNQLCSQKHLARFATVFQGSEQFTAKIQQEVNEAHASVAYDPNRDISGTVENQKRYYLDSGNSQTCMERVQVTLGFHPRSLVCARCPAAKDCAHQLQTMVTFDIMALRRGEITAEHAQHVARLYGSYTQSSNGATAGRAVSVRG